MLYGNPAADVNKQEGYGVSCYLGHYCQLYTHQYIFYQRQHHASGREEANTKMIQNISINLPKL